MTVMPDVTRAITMDVKRPGDVVIVVGETRDELGGSEYLGLLARSGGRTPRVDKYLSKPILHAVAACTKAGVVNAAHDCSDGGLGVCLAEMAFAGGFGLDIDADLVPRATSIQRLDTLLFSESNSRIVLTVPVTQIAQAEQILAAVPHARIGSVVAQPDLRISGLGGSLSAPLAGLKEAWQGTLRSV